MLAVYWLLPRRGQNLLLLLFVLLWTFSARPRPTMSVTGLFLLAYGAFRFAVEFVRTPDQHLGVDGYLAFGWVTMGQVLTVPMIVGGIAMIVLAYRGHVGRVGQPG